MTDVLQNQFGLKPKNQGHVYTSPFLEWYHRVALPNRVKVPTEFSKFSRQDDTSTVEHIARYLMQLGEASADEAFRIRYFCSVLNRPSIYMVHFSAFSFNLLLEGFGTKVPFPLVH
jgi:hypothetical protein